VLDGDDRVAYRRRNLHEGHDLAVDLAVQVGDDVAVGVVDLRRRDVQPLERLTRRKGDEMAARRGEQRHGEEGEQRTAHPILLLHRPRIRRISAVPTPDEQLKTLTRNTVDVLPTGALERKLASGKPLRVKLGLYPTAEHVTLGWAVPLRRLRAFQALGHQAVLIVGDFTARIGDPSEKASTRKILSKDEVDAFAQRVLDQFFLILDREATEIRYNSEWLEPLGVEGFLDLASHQTVAHTLQRDDFAQRYASGSPLSLREFVYPLLQGYDSVAINADVELGGTDQLFNLLVGRDLQRAQGQDEQVVITKPLIEGTDGVKKMSQSEGNYIGITEPPDEIFGKLMRVPDALMEKYFRLTTELDDGQIAEALALPPQEAKRRLGEEVVALYH